MEKVVGLFSGARLR